MQEAIKKLSEIQRKLKAPKSNKNTFGNYMYRSCEDILEAVKPILGEAALMLSDDVKQVGDRIYIAATATLHYQGESISSTAYARESETKKGMDDSQITGSASSYARKYALNGLFAIDDTKDADTQDNREQGARPHPNSVQAKEAKEKARESDPLVKVLIGYLASEEYYDFAREALEEITDEQEKIRIWNLFNTREKEIVRSFSKKD